MYRDIAVSRYRRRSASSRVFRPGLAAAHSLREGPIQSWMRVIGTEGSSTTTFIRNSRPPGDSARLRESLLSNRRLLANGC